MSKAVSATYLYLSLPTPLATFAKHSVIPHTRIAFNLAKSLEAQWRLEMGLRPSVPAAFIGLNGDWV